MTTRRHNTTDASRFMRALCQTFSAREIARRINVSDRTVRRWASGEDWCDADVLHMLVDKLFPVSVAGGPVYSGDMAIDGNTRVGGVGEFTIRSAKGDMDYVRTSRMG